MLRSFHSFPVENITDLKRRMLSWVNQFNICCFLDNHSYQSLHHTVESMAAAGVYKIFQPGSDYFNDLSAFVKQSDDYIFGHFNYDLKNRTEPGLVSKNPDLTGFPEGFLFVPEVVFLLQNDALQIGVISADADVIYHEILHQQIAVNQSEPVEIKERVSRSQYIDAIQHLIRHIHLGDCYVINYCMEFFATAAVEPLHLYRQLSGMAPNPFGAYYKLNDHHLLCASPERYLKRQGNTIISQPIKGTAPRNHADSYLDHENKTMLRQSQKERSENVMVVDLVRNDLGKFCQSGTVQVDELFGIYSYPNVHQMISTVSGKINRDVGFGEMLKATFPMGSMTGAPKRRVMELIDQYEHSQRGIYSGTVGYIAPNGDFDFNVVIRSLVYNRSSHHLSYHVGSAITAYCDPAQEYEECLLKGRTIAQLLSQQ